MLEEQLKTASSMSSQEVVSDSMNNSKIFINKNEGNFLLILSQCIHLLLKCHLIAVQKYSSQSFVTSSSSFGNNATVNSRCCMKNTYSNGLNNRSLYKSSLTTKGNNTTIEMTLSYLCNHMIKIWNSFALCKPTIHVSDLILLQEVVCIVNLLRQFQLFYHITDLEKSIITVSSGFPYIVAVENSKYNQLINLAVFDLIIDWNIKFISLYSYVTTSLDNLATMTIKTDTNNSFSDSYILKLFMSLSLFVNKLNNENDQNNNDDRHNNEFNSFNEKILIFSNSLYEAIHSNEYESISKRHLLLFEQLVIILDVMSITIFQINDENSNSNIIYTQFMDCIINIHKILQIIQPNMISSSIISKICAILSLIFINISNLNLPLNNVNMEQICKIPNTLLDISLSKNETTIQLDYFEILNLFYYCHFDNLYDITLEISIKLCDTKIELLCYLLRIIFEKRKELSPIEFIELLIQISINVCNTNVDDNNMIAIFQCISNLIINCSSSDTPYKLITFMKPFFIDISTYTKPSFRILEIVLVCNLLIPSETTKSLQQHHVITNDTATTTNNSSNTDEDVKGLYMTTLVMNLKQLILTIHFTESMTEFICTLLRKSYLFHNNNYVVINDLIHQINLELVVLEKKSSSLSSSILFNNIKHIIRNIKNIKYNVSSAANEDTILSSSINFVDVKNVIDELSYVIETC